MELKRSEVYKSFAVLKAFNRTNMELKLQYSVRLWIGRGAFNRTNMELKRFKVESLKINAIPLIEPIWN